MLIIKKKLSFVLLEVMIALALTILLVFPIIRSTFFGYKKQIEDVQQIELEKVFNDSYSLALENLYNKNPSWETIKKKGAKTFIYLPDYTLKFNKGSVIVNRRYKVTCVKGKNFKTEDLSEEYRLFQITLELQYLKTNWQDNKRAHLVMARNILQ